MQCIETGGTWQVFSTWLAGDSRPGRRGYANAGNRRRPVLVVRAISVSPPFAPNAARKLSLVTEPHDSRPNIILCYLNIIPQSAGDTGVHANVFELGSNINPHVKDFV